jgi:hypothetical protein
MKYDYDKIVMEKENKKKADREGNLQVGQMQDRED